MSDKFYLLDKLKPHSHPNCKECLLKPRNQREKLSFTAYLSSFLTDGFIYSVAATTTVTIAVVIASVMLHLHQDPDFLFFQHGHRSRSVPAWACGSIQIPGLSIYLDFLFCDMKTIIIALYRSHWQAKLINFLLLFICAIGSASLENPDSQPIRIR